MPYLPSLNFYKDSEYNTSPIIVLPTDTYPEGILAGHQVEQRLADETWQTIGYQGEDKPAAIHLRMSTGELVHYIERPAELPAPLSSEEDVPVHVRERKGDRFVRLGLLPEGWYRVAGLEVNRTELLRLLPKLQASWEGVFYPTPVAGAYAFWQLNDGYGNWCSLRLKRQTLASAEDIGLHYLLSESGPHTLYRLEYEDIIRPGLLPGLSREHCLCVGYNRPNGPEMLLVVETLLLREWWPQESLREVLTTQELAQANLAPIPTQVA